MVVTEALDLVQQKIAGRSADLVAVVELLLQLAQQAGELRCTLAGEDRLRVELRGQEASELEVVPAKSRLRTMCARLAVLCQESGHDFLPYGGEGTIRQTWNARWMNTPDEHWFTIVAL